MVKARRRPISEGTAEDLEDSSSSTSDSGSPRRGNGGDDDLSTMATNGTRQIQKRALQVPEGGSSAVSANVSSNASEENCSDQS